MKKLVICLSLVLNCSLLAAAEWWRMPTICKPDNTECYPGLAGSGLDPEEWDVSGRCKGKKLVCPNAIVAGAPAPEAFSMAEISDVSIVSPDFDIETLDTLGGCFGMRKTRNNGTVAKVGNRWVNVYCAGILDSPDDMIQNGELMLTELDQPTCRTLSQNGYLGVINGQCYGKFGYPETDFYIECADESTCDPNDDKCRLLPRRIAVLNGADKDRIRTDSMTSPAPSAYPATEAAAAAKFATMIDNARERREASE